ncbi:LuxR C-terminal-related transcriptional regulator, partial [Escherichia coli]
RKYFSLLAVVLFIAFSGAYAYWSMELEDMISTDDAYVTGNADPISAQVSGSVMRYILDGKDNNDIAEKMFISNKTVSTYKSRLMEKLECKSLMDLYTFAQRNKIG